MTATLGFTTKKTGSTTTVTTTGGTTTGGPGTIFLVSIGWYSGTLAATPITDSNSNVYTQVQSTVTGSVDAAFHSALFYKVGGVGGASHTFSVTCTGAPNLMSIRVTEWKSLAVSPVDQAPVGNNDVLSPFVSTTTSATTQADEVAVAFLDTYTTAGTTSTLDWTANGYTQIDAETDVATWTAGWAYKLLSTTGAQTSSAAESGGTATDGITFIITLKASIPAADTATQKLIKGYFPHLRMF